MRAKASLCSGVAFNQKKCLLDFLLASIEVFCCSSLSKDFLLAVLLLLALEYLINIHERINILVASIKKTMKIPRVMRDRARGWKKTKQGLGMRFIFKNIIILDEYTSHQDLWAARAPLFNTRITFSSIQKFIAFNLIMHVEENSQNLAKRMAGTSMPRDDAMNSSTKSEIRRKSSALKSLKYLKSNEFYGTKDFQRLFHEGGHD